MGDSSFSRSAVPDPHMSVQTVTVLQGHAAGLTSIRFAPDGTLLASADGRTIRLWQADADGRWALQRVLEVPAEILAFSPDGQALAFSERFGGVQVWSRQGRPIAQLLSQEQEGLDVAFSPDGTVLATADPQGRLLLWDAATYDLRLTLQIAPDAETGLPAVPLTSLTFAPGGTYLAFACRSRERKVQVWKVHKPQPQAVELSLEWVSAITNRDEAIYDVAFSPNGQVLAVATGVSRRTWLFEVPSWTLAGSLEMPRQGTIPVAIAFSPDGRLLAVAGDDGVVWIWAVASQHIVTSFEAHTERRVRQSYAIGAIAWSPDATVLATGRKDDIYVYHPTYGYGVGPGNYTVKVWKVQEA